MSAPSTDPAPDDRSTVAFPRPDDGTPTFHASEQATHTVPTPEGYQPPSAPGPPLPDDHAPPQDSRFQAPQFYKKGGMGRVFAADDAELNRRVAVKDIQPRHQGIDWYRRKFIFEAEVTGELEHPGIVPVYSLRRPTADTDHPYYAMRFVEGDTLAAAIEEFHRDGPTTSLSGEQSVGLRRMLARFLTVCQTIAYAHSRRIIHRDLKPDNILLGPFGETLVVDWGLAKRLSSGETAPEVSTDTVASSTGGGTPGYWSPEQAERAAERHDERTDVYGLGAVLFAILTGRPPHPQGVHAARPPQPRDESPWVDAALDGIVTKALALDPTYRHRSAGELAARVERWMADQPVAAQWDTVAILREQSTDNPNDTVLREQLARQISNLGQVYQGMGRNSEAADAVMEAAVLFRELFKLFPQTPRFRAEQANCYITAARLYQALGRATAAQSWQAQAAEIYRGLIATHPGEYRQNLATIIITRELALPPRPVPPTNLDLQGTGEFSLPSWGTTNTEKGTEADMALPDQQRTDAELQIPDVPEPELVQGYTVTRVIGEGGSGRVLLARDNALQRMVAIKEFTQEFTGVRGQRFLREIQLTANLRHPNIVQVYTYGIHSGSGRPFLVMEYIAGRSLQEEARLFHQSPSPMTPANPAFTRLVKAFAQACEALEYAHANKIAHRDAKPANVIVQPDGAAVVIDWGIAKGFAEARDLAAEDVGDDENFSANLTLTGAVVGTPVFISPEHLLHNERANAAQDIYALGVGLFEILTGQLPFTGTSFIDIMAAKASGEVVRPRTLNTGVPGDLERICLKAMAKDPTARHTSAGDLFADVNRWLRSQGADVSTGRGGRTWRASPSAEMHIDPPAALPTAVPPAGRLNRLWAWVRGR